MSAQKCDDRQKCAMRRKTCFSVGSLSEAECGVSDAELADFLTFGKSPLGREVVAFRWCPWCGGPWVHNGKIVEPPLADHEEGEEWKK